MDLASGAFPRRFGRGLTYPFRGLVFLLRNRDLWPLVVVPVVLTISLLVSAGYATIRLTPRIVEAIWPMPGGGWAALWVVTVVLLGVVIFGISAVLVYAVSGLLAVPFNDWLSQQVETKVVGRREEPFSWPVFLGDLKQSIAHSILGLLMWIAVMLPMWLLELLPGIGSALHVVLGAIATAFFLSREMMDGVMSRRRISFKNKLRVVGSHVALMQGFGLATSALLWVPLLNFLCLPISVIGGTLLFCDLERQGLLPPEARR